MAKMSIGQIIVGGLVVIIYGAVMALYLLKPGLAPEGNTEWSMLIGALISSFTIVLGWFFGSSKSSADKTALLKMTSSITPK
jgi:membrane protein implicated in regulation of membrane protease activity